MYVVGEGLQSSVGYPALVAVATPLVSRLFAAFSLFPFDDTVVWVTGVAGNAAFAGALLACCSDATLLKTPAITDAPKTSSADNPQARSVLDPKQGLRSSTLLACLACCSDAT